MGFIGGRLGYFILKKITPKALYSYTAKPEWPDSKLEKFFGKDVFGLLKGKTVIDFGCGFGNQSVKMALEGAGRVIGVDIREKVLIEGRELAAQHHVADRCIFTTSTDESADVIVSVDCFEHYTDPAAALISMSKLLKPGGFVLVSFGPPWLHPYGSHLWPIFPWVHLVFTERALLRWRADHRSDGATKFSEIDGGMNKMTIKRFERLVENSPFRFEYLELIPIRGIKFLKNRIFREFGTSVVCCKLVFK